MLWYFLLNNLPILAKARVPVAKRFAGGKIPLLALSPFGLDDGDASQGLEASAAAVWVDNRTGVIRFQTGIGENQINLDAPLDTYLTGLSGRHFSKLSICPDQNSRRVIAWTENDVISVSRVGVANAEDRVSWVGCDCSIFNDSFVLDASAGEPTDVIAFYLSVDRMTVFYRLQRENFALEHVYFVLTEPVSLDTVLRAGFSIGLWLTTKAKNTFCLISDNYPVRAKDGISFGASLQAGAHTVTVVQADPMLEGVSFGASLISGSHFQTIVQADATLEGMLFGVSLQAGVYFQTIVQADATLEGVSFGASLISGAQAVTVVQRDDASDGIAFSVGLVGGAYV